MGLKKTVGNFLKISFLYGFALFVVIIFAGCSESEKINESVFLIKTPSMEITSFEFSEELDLKRAAYPYNIDENSAEYNEMVIHLVQILSEEMILLSEAVQKGVVVTDEELVRAEIEFKKDYPDDSFDQMLLRNAIPYALWKKRFRRDMIIEKLVEQELVEKIEITSQDIVKFYNKLKVKENPPPPVHKTDKTDISSKADKKVDSETELVSRLRMQKTQEKYEQWIQDLWNQYPIEINKEELKTFMIELEETKGSANETKN